MRLPASEIQKKFLMFVGNSGSDYVAGDCVDQGCFMITFGDWRKMRKFEDF